MISLTTFNAVVLCLDSHVNIKNSFIVQLDMFFLKYLSVKYMLETARSLFIISSDLLYIYTSLHLTALLKFPANSLSQIIVSIISV